MPNSIAYLVLALWPLVMFVLFRRLPVGRALIWSFLGGYLLLPPFPAAFDFPLMPPLNKETLPNVAALAMVVFVAKERVKLWPESGIAKALIAVFVFGPILTVLANPEPVLFATGGLRGLIPMDMLALAINQTILLIGFALARQFLNTKEHLRDILIALMIAGLVYSFPMLLEVRLSPQLNLWIYGYFQHVFEQMIRGDGFRSIVFLSHGIWAAMFTMMALAAAIILWRTEAGKSKSWFLIAAIFLGIVLVLNKTLSPVLYSFVLITMMIFSNWRAQARLAVVLAALSLAYPLAKTVDLVPEEQLLTLAAKASEDRANSLRFRFDNEDILFDRAMEKPLFGWGTWGRNHRHDPITGTILTVTDGRWIITVGVFGWIGFLAEFGLLTLPIFLFARAALAHQKHGDRQWKSQIQIEIPVRAPAEQRLRKDAPSPLGGAVALLLALNLVDLMPNATLTPITWMLAGALLGYAETIRHGLKSQGQGRRKTPLDGLNRVEIRDRPRTVL